MRKIREILRLRWECGLSNRAIARSLGISHSTVIDTLHRAEAAGLGGSLPEATDDAALESMLYPGNREQSRKRPQPDWEWVCREQRRHKHVTLQLLWFEYKRAHPDGYQYSRFCQLYRRWQEKLDVVLRQEHRAGEKLFVDYAGQKVPVIDPHTGDAWSASIFVAVLGASNYTYAEATRAQGLPSWITAHVRAFEFFGGVPAIVVPDNTGAAVVKTCRYEPDLNPTYHELADHYGTAIVPARPARPRDKAKVEVGVQVVERWILAALRHHTFFSLAELNAAIAGLLEELNDRPFKKLEGTRRALYEALDRPALKPLPSERYEYAEWVRARVQLDSHVTVEGACYSVPHALVREEVDVRLTCCTVEAFYRGRRVACHARSYRPGHYVTDEGHLPASHRKHLEWTPRRLVSWAETVGHSTGRLIRMILESRPHPEQGYRSCLGIMRLGRRYDHRRLEAACHRALRIGAHSYRSVKSILERGLDQKPLESPRQAGRIVRHANVRGASYYARKEAL